MRKARDGENVGNATAAAAALKEVLERCGRGINVLPLQPWKKEQKKKNDSSLTGTSKYTDATEDGRQRRNE